MIARLPIQCELLLQHSRCMTDAVFIFVSLKVLKRPLNMEAEVFIMLDQSGIQKILRENLPDADNALLSRLTEEVEKEMESHAQLFIRNLLTQGSTKTRGALFNVDIKI